MANMNNEEPRFPLLDFNIDLDTETDLDQPIEIETGGQIPVDSINPSLLALAMGFVPIQAWEEPYANDLALARGTIFPSLDKPFLGEEALPR